MGEMSAYLLDFGKEKDRAQKLERGICIYRERVVEDWAWRRRKKTKGSDEGGIYDHENPWKLTEAEKDTWDTTTSV